MAIVSKELIDALKHCNDDVIIVNHENEEFIHMNKIKDNRFVLSVKPKLGHCNKCGYPVFESDISNYSAVCTNCDENLFRFEYTVIEESNIIQ